QNLIPPSVKEMAEHIQKEGNVYGHKSEISVSGQGEIAFLFDASTHVLAPHMKAAIVIIAEKLNIPLKIIDIPSAGFLEWDLGFREEAAAMAKEVAHLLAE